MNITYHCPACHKLIRHEISGATETLECPECHGQITVPEKAISGNRLNRCLVCPSVDLFARKDFPQRLGVALVVFGFVGSSIAWANYQVFWTFAILFATALIDLLLYIFMGESLTCYRCGAQYRGFDDIEIHGGFDLETHERYRQLAARMKSSSALQPTSAAK
jgi:DNA-directed RNA polymerase subunit RPC12/RpoP